MTNTPTTQPDDATKAIAIQGDDLVTVNLPSPPLTPEERETEFRALLGNLEGSSDGDGAPSTELTALGQDLERTDSGGKFWRFLNPFDKNELDLLVATLLGENRFDKTRVNEITLRGDGTVLAADFDESRHYLYYEDNDSPLNFVFPHRGSQIIGHALNLYGRAFSPFPQVMLAHFDYVLDAPLNDGEIVDIFKFGDSLPIIQHVGGRGLVLNRANYERHSVTTSAVNNILLRPIYSAHTYYRIELSPEDAGAGVDFERLYFYVPPLCQPHANTIKIRINVRFAPDDPDGGFAGKIYDLTDINTDQVLERGARFQRGTNPDLILDVLYVADDQGHHAIHLRTAVGAPVRTIVIYDITAALDYRRYIAGVDRSSYEQIPLLSGTDRAAGEVDACGDHELQRNRVNKIMLEIKQGSGGFMHVRVVINGVVKNDGAFYDTHRSAGHMGVHKFRRYGAGNGVFIGGPKVRISRLYIAKALLPLTAAQLLQIQAATDTPGAVYYGLRAANPTYKLGAQLQVRDGDGEFFTVGAGGGNPVLDENGNPKNFLTSPITSTSANGQLNQRTIPEMATAKAIVVVVGEVDTDGNGDTVLTDDSSRMIFDPRPFSRSHSITGRIGQYTSIHYYFSFPRKDTIRLDHRTTGAGDSNGIHQIFLLR